MKLQLSLRPRPIALVLEIVALILCMISFVLNALNVANDGQVYGIRRLAEFFDVNHDATLPTFYSLLLFVLAFILLALMTRYAFAQGDKIRWFWAGLMLPFAYLTLDEGTAMHDAMTDVLQNNIAFEGALRWLVLGAGGIIGLLVVVASLYALWQLPAWTRYSLMLSAALFIAGFLGFEKISESLWYAYGPEFIWYQVWGTVEELLEMSGVILFAYTMTHYLFARVDQLDMAVTLAEDAD